MTEQIQQRVSAVYGPVNSWRFGRSLGIDLICETSVCSFNCIYCQLGDIQIVTNERRLFVPTAQVIRDLENVNWTEVDIITFSGSGEPTLATNLGEVARHLKRFGKTLSVLTNATHFHNAEVRRDLAELDIVDAKLDAASDEMLQRYNRPAPGHTIRSIVEGIQLLRKEFRGKLSLQIMIMPINLREAERLAALINEIHPDEVQLNTPRRPYPAEWHLETRGAHKAPEELPFPSKPLKTISKEEAQKLEMLLRERCHVPIRSIYKSQCS